MNCIKDKFLLDLPENRWFPPINVCDCPKDGDSPEFNGLPKVILEKNLLLRVNHCGRPEKYNLLDLDSFLTENTIYIVLYNFDLNGGIIRIPKNSTLVFYGGSIANGTILLDETSIYPILDLDKYLFCRISGTYKKGQIKSDENGIYYWNGSEWKIASNGQNTPTPNPGKEYINGVGITIKEDNSINLNSAEDFSLGGIRTGFISTDVKYAVKTDEYGNAYVEISKQDNKNITFFTSYVFKRSEIKPDPPIGGDYLNPIPFGWEDGIPVEGTSKVWVSRRTFYSDGSSSDWTSPVFLADSPEMDICFSSRTNPNPPTSHGEQLNEEWHNDAKPEDIWMAISLYSMGSWGPWQILKVKGELGPEGSKGKDGNSINIIGEYLDSDSLLSHIENSNVFLGFNIDNVRPINITIHTGDTLKIKEGDFDGHLMYCMDISPVTWLDLGVIEGAATYVHIKFSNDNGVTFTEVPEGSSTILPGDTPGDYIGFLTDNKIEATLNTSLYTWAPFRGNDGFGYWYIYAKLTPELMETPDFINYYKNLFTYNSSTGNFSDRNTFWNDEPLELKPGEYLYISYIKDPLYKGKKWSYPRLWNSYPILYSLTVLNNDEAILDLNKSDGLKQNKNISWKLFINGKESFDYSPYEFLVYVGNTYINSVRNGNTWNLNNVGYGTKKSIISVKVYKNNVFLCLGDLIIPIRGKDGENKESTGFKIVLSNVLGVMPCNLDGLSISGATTSTSILAYYNETKLSSDLFTVTLEDGTPLIIGSNYNALLERKGDSYTLTVSRLNKNTSSVPFIVSYNGILYSKEFKIFKDLEGDSYELYITPLVVTSEFGEVNIKVFKTYDRATNKVVHKEITNLRENNLRITYWDETDSEVDVTSSELVSNKKFLVRKNSEITLFENDVIIDILYVTYVNVGESSLGLLGCVLRFRGNWESGKLYVNQLNDTGVSATSIRWIDYVKYNNKFYLVSPLVRTTTVEPTSNNVGTGKAWIEAESMDFAYIQTLISEYISSTSIQAKQVLITRENSGITNIVAGIHQGNQSSLPLDNTIIWSGTSIQENPQSDNLDVTSAPFLVREDGTLIATKAKITGDILANSFTTGETLEPGIVVITGSFENYEGFKNPNKIYFANDGNGNFNIYFYYDGQWLPMNLGIILSPLLNTTLDYYTIEFDDTINGIVTLTKGELRKINGTWSSTTGKMYQDWGNLKVIVSVDNLDSPTSTELSESSKYVTLDIRLFREIKIENNHILLGINFVILSKDKYNNIRNGRLNKNTISESNKYYRCYPQEENQIGNVPINIYSEGNINNALFTISSMTIIPCGYNILISGGETVFSQVINNSIKTVGFA